MTSSQAELIITEYGAVLEQACSGDGAAYCLSRLPAPPQRIMQAMKLALASDIHSGALTEDMRNHFGGGASFLTRFIPDDEAQRLNDIKRNFKSSDVARLPPDEFRKQSQIMGEVLNWTTNAMMAGLTLRSELTAFIESVQQLDPRDSLFWQRVYTLAGLEYSAPAKPAPKKRTFWDWFS
ncbi:MAG: hypothetical protein ABL974_20535 [Prosthecobacter sp.]